MVTVETKRKDCGFP